MTKKELAELIALIDVPCSYEFKKVNTRDIAVDHLYQRVIIERNINLINECWCDFLYTEPRISFRDGKYWVFDGQHTVVASKLHNGGQDLNIECKVFYGLTEENEYRLFLAQRGITSALGANEEMRAKSNFHDVKTCVMISIAENCGLIVDFEKGSATNRIVATKALACEFNKVSEVAFTDGLTAIKAAWHGDPSSLRAEILKAVIEFCNIYFGEYKMERLISILKQNDPLDIIRSAKNQGASGNAKYPLAIVTLYNNKLRNKLDPKKV